jgi:hypothetical protein
MLIRKENNMQISPEEIDTIEDAGMLDQHPVRLIRTKGGFWICVGKPKGKLKEEAIGAGSHPAIVKFNVEKMYPDFQPAMMKSEYFSDSTVVEKHSHFLSDELRKSGYDLYSVQLDNDVDFHITKHHVATFSVNSKLENGTMVIKQMNVGKEFARALAGATTEKAMSCGASKVKLGVK